MKKMSMVVLCLVLAGCAGVQAPPPGAAPEPEGRLFEKMGVHERPITTSSPEAQEYFNQGLTWMYAFNHDEAVRSFRRAADLDPDCAMAWWGVSLAAGPQYNHPKMDDRRIATAWEGLQEALERIDNTSPVERALIEALKERYAAEEPEDRAALNEAYALAMEKVWEQYPDDSDVGALYAEAMMVRRPWKLYELDHTPHEDTPTIVATLERVLEMDPDNPGASHLHIHAVEPSAEPERAIPSADRLQDLVHGSGHLLHMASHIYVRVGMWDKAVTQNEKAVVSDASYRDRAPHLGTQYFYQVHNAHMLAFAAMMSGREQDAMAAARVMWETVPEDDLRRYGPRVDRWMCSVFDVQKRFGRWDELLAEPAPPEYLPVTTAVWRAARAVAYAAKKDIESAEREYKRFRKAKKKVPKDYRWGRDGARKVLEVSDYFIRGEIELQQGNLAAAAELLEKAAVLEDALSYGEPPQWLQPVRHTLGAVYLLQGDHEAAEEAYRTDLGEWRNNGWSLYGLSRALEGQGRMAEAAEVAQEYESLWAKADEPTETSCKCIPKT